MISGEFRVASTAEQVASTLRAALLRGELAPGTRLEEMKLASQFGVSRNTVREALQLLAGENLVQRTLHRSVVVREIGDAADIIDLYRARMTMELAAVEAAVVQDDSWFARLESGLSAIASANNRSELDDADLQFHAALVSAIGSTRIARFYQRIHTELRLTRGWTERAPVDPTHVAATHAPLYHGLVARDAAAATTVLRSILHSGEVGLLEAIEKTATSPTGRPADARVDGDTGAGEGSATTPDS